ncbi:4'-phosphopantetheinyl transferase family protein [Shewanella sp. 0m-4]
MSEFTSIKLYFCPLRLGTLDADSAALIKTWLPQDEADKVNRYIKQEAKDQGLMVRGYLRALLSRQVSKQASLKPHEWCFEYGDKGKPRLSAAQFKQTGIHFNISHSGDWLLVGICQSNSHSNSQSNFRSEHANQTGAIEFGVDIERCRSSTNIHSILSHYFSEPEKTALLALPTALQRERFFDLWALKESYIKAKGLGLALSLKSFAFDFAPLIETSLELDGAVSISPTIKTATSELDTAHLPVNQNIPVKHNIDLKQGIPLKQSICLSIAQGHGDGQDEMKARPQQMTVAKDWHCWLGHLDANYRFALSIGPCHQASINAAEVNLKSLLAD